jgi:prephenate dehydrogenase
MPGADRELLIIGTGLIGTSVGLAAGAVGWTVWLSDNDPGRTRVAASLGAGTPLEPGRGLSPALVLAAVPPAMVGPVCIDALRTYPQAVVSHVGSVQSKPLLQVEASGADVGRFVGGHPIAGREVSGPAAADRELFVDRPWVLCRAAGTGARAFDLVHDLAVDCRARPVELAPDEHDRLLARLSHAPQLVASALAATVAGLAPAEAALSGPGLRDTTRLADSDPLMWGQIAAANAGAVAQALRAVAEPLLRVAERLEASTDEASTDEPSTDEAERHVAELMRLGRAGRALLPGKHGRPPVALASVHCVIPDEPGALARLFVEVAAVGVNIEDVRVEHAPGQPLGTAELAVAVSDQSRLISALTERGWAASAGAGASL